LDGYERVGAVVLAAGESKRMGFPKQLIEICGDKAIRIVVRKALTAGFREVIVVLGYMHKTISRYLEGIEGIRILVNHRYPEGMGTSLAEGVRALGRGLDAFMVILCDQPFVSIETMRMIVEAYYEHGGEPLMVFPTYMGTRGNPALISSRLSQEIMRLRGDIGARALLDMYRDKVLYVEVGDPGVVLDIDTKEDLDRAMKIFGSMCPQPGQRPSLQG